MIRSLSGKTIEVLKPLVVIEQIIAKFSLVIFVVNKMKLVVKKDDHQFPHSLVIIAYKYPLLIV